MKSQATILMTARNAGTTIERALSSALDQGDYPILLIDDASNDDTAERARGAAGSQLRIIHLATHRTLGFARQTALLATQTPFAVWLDADDELLPGRVNGMVKILQCDEYDLVSDAVELFDGTKGSFQKILSMPTFLTDSHPLARLFERNYLPAVGAVGIRTDYARRIGYDTRLDGAEDMDFALRAIAAGARFCLLARVGYRLYTYSNSHSRRVGNQRNMLRICLLKHDYNAIRRLYRQAGHSERVTAWGLVSVAMYRNDYPRVLDFVSQAESMMRDPDEILEPAGPCPMPEIWRVCFYRGTARLLMGQLDEASSCLQAAERAFPSAEGANNLGVVKGQLGEPAAAKKLFAAGLRVFPGYLDAHLNLETLQPDRITSHPLRNIPNRNDYSTN